MTHHARRRARPTRDGWAYPDGMAQTAPVETERPVGDEDVVPDVPRIVIVWNDPINLMSYVVYVFQKLFGYPREKATRLMLDVHHKGRAVVSTGPRERCEFDVSVLHGQGRGAPVRRSRRGGFDFRIPTVEREVLGSIPEMLRALLVDGDAADPALQRLYPKALPDDEEASAASHDITHKEL